MEKMNTEKNLPVQKFKAGPVSATIWGNETLKDNAVVNYHTVALERVYKDKATGAWKHTSSFRIGDLPKAALVINKAYEFLQLNNTIAEQEA